MTARQRKADLAWERACVATIRREYAGCLVATIRAVLEKRKEKAFEAIFDSCDVRAALAEMPVFSPHSDFVGEAIEWLRARAGGTT